jgi:hypothetical protein
MCSQSGYRSRDRSSKKTSRAMVRSFTGSAGKSATSARARSFQASTSRRGPMMQAGTAVRAVPGPHHAAFTHFLSGGCTDATHIMLWAIAAFCGVATVVVHVLLAERPAARAVPPSDADPDAAVVALPVESEPEQVSR